MGVGQRRIDPPAAGRRPVRQWEAVGGGRDRARLAVVREPELRAPGSSSSRGHCDQRVMLGRRADPRLVAKHFLGQRPLADRAPARSPGGRWADGRRCSAGARVAHRDLAVHAERLARHQAVEALGRARGACVINASTSAADGTPVPTVPPNRPRPRPVRARPGRSPPPAGSARAALGNRQAATRPGPQSTAACAAHSPLAPAVARYRRRAGIEVGPSDIIDPCHPLRRLRRALRPTGVGAAAM